MALEDLGVKKQAFVDLQEEAKARIYLASGSLPIFVGLLRSQSLGGQFHLAFVLEQLIKLGLDFRDYLEQGGHWQRLPRTLGSRLDESLASRDEVQGANPGSAQLPVGRRCG
jgi:hypothetical protein